MATFVTFKSPLKAKGKSKLKRVTLPPTGNSRRKTPINAVNAEATPPLSQKRLSFLRDARGLIR